MYPSNRGLIMTPADPEISNPEARRPVIGVTFSCVHVNRVGKMDDMVTPLSATVTQTSSVWLNKTLNKIPSIMTQEEMYEKAISFVDEIYAKIKTPMKFPTPYVPKYTEVKVEAGFCNQCSCSITNVTRKLGNKSMYAVAINEFMNIIQIISCFILFGSLFLLMLSLLYCLVAFLTRRLERKATRNGKAAEKTRMPVIRKAYWILVSGTAAEPADELVLVTNSCVIELPVPDMFRLSVVPLCVKEEFDSVDPASFSASER